MSAGLQADLIRARDLLNAYRSGDVSHGSRQPDYSYKEWCERLATVLPSIIEAAKPLAGIADPAAQVERWKAMEQGMRYIAERAVLEKRQPIIDASRWLNMTPAEIAKLAAEWTP